MKAIKLFLLIVMMVLVITSFGLPGLNEATTIGIGTKAPDFKLPGVDGKTYSLASFSKAKILVVIFTCNHCPTAQAYEDRIIQFTAEYQTNGVAVVAISPNDPLAVRLDELGYTDLGDTFEEMKLRASQKNYNFPYLYDGETETVSRAYGPIATPHIFVFDEDRKLRYQGRFDDVEKPSKTPTNFDTRNAVNALLSKKPVPVETTKVFGCSVKWAEKKDYQQKALDGWAKETVALESIDETGIKALVKNNSEKLRLITIWATWCGPCVTEFPEFITINRMYRGRDFEFISLSADDPEKKEKVHRFLKEKQASGKNYLFDLDDKYKLIEAVDPTWQGALPYTILVEPGGKIVYGRQGPIDPSEMKKMIVENRLIGRYY